MIVGRALFTSALKLLSLMLLRDEIHFIRQLSLFPTKKRNTVYKRLLKDLCFNHSTNIFSHFQLSRPDVAVNFVYNSFHICVSLVLLLHGVPSKTFIYLI